MHYRRVVRNMYGRLLWLGLVFSGLVHGEGASLQDPTKPAIEVLAKMPELASASSAQPLSLNGLKANGTQSVALVNNIFVKVGDRVQGYRFMGVQGQAAIFEDEAHQKLELKPSIVDYKQFPTVANAAKKRKKHRNHDPKE